MTVEIQAGGRSLIRVTDDGMGMSRDDALLCLERHATSKIRRAEDLAAIGTMGFRGEALPSIASVSRFTLTTLERASDSPEGTQIIIAGGKILEVKAAGTSPGTTVEVRQLFFNLPARRKFLRTEETEAAHIQHYLMLAALAFPEVAFAFQKDGRLVWQLPAVKTGAERRSAAGRFAGTPARALWPGAEAAGGGLLGRTGVPRSARIEEAASPPAIAVRLWGFMGGPGVSRSTREDQHLFVNRRPVENRGLNFALLEGYHTALMKGRYPVCCLFLEIPPAEVDVNIHPAKREVKFHREGEVRRLVAQAVRQTLLEFHAGQTGAKSQSPAESEARRHRRPQQTAPQPAPATGAGAPCRAFQPAPAQPKPAAQPVPAQRPPLPSLPPPSANADPTTLTGHAPRITQHAPAPPPPAA